jgi:DNA-binding MarR family transcriptional regulator
VSTQISGGDRAGREDPPRRGERAGHRAQPDHEALLAEVIAEAPRHAAAAVRLNIAIAHQAGMGLADVQCIGLLTDGPSAPSRLAEQLGLTTGAMTKVLDRLEYGGYISRSPDPADRRRVVITVNPGALGELAGQYAAMGERMSDYLSGRSTAELAAILTFMYAGREAADAEISRIRHLGVGHATRRPATRRAGPASDAAEDAPKAHETA